MAIYMQIEGIQGTVKAEGYSGWIELHSAEFSGINTRVVTRTGRMENRVQSMPNFGNFKLAKRTDKSSTKLFQAAHNAKVLPKVLIAYVSTGNGVKVYHKYSLTNVLISHFSDIHNEHLDFPTENITLNYDSIQKTFIPRLSDNTADSPLISGYNVEEATES